MALESLHAAVSITAKLPDSEEGVEEMILKKYELQEKLGFGPNSVVWRATCKFSRHTVVLKKRYEAFKSPEDAQRTYREIIYNKLFNGHDNIIRLQKVLLSQFHRDIYIVYDYVEADLLSVIRRNLLNGVQKQYVM